jgi:hypothetical protein
MATLISTLYTTKRKASYLTFQKENKDIRREREREREIPLSWHGDLLKISPLIHSNSIKRKRK